ncbi:hypothetical protein HK100_007409 [Physocladia obscura]|uniref:Uncharacterized protein n=1 Tax=Physocladia obscura TaxID=109957 RepID=A0AAD5SPB4_9FUNG|nr:hypothetical protein HK100_007409 [Physocladia obscura]
MGAPTFMIKPPTPANDIVIIQLQPPPTLRRESGVVWIASPRKKHMQHRIKTRSSENWGDLFRLSNSILPAVFAPCLVLTAWAALVCVFYLVSSIGFLKIWGLPNSVLLITILGSAMSLLLVFRVNTAYDRYYEGRKLWNTVHFQIRNLARFIWIYSASATKEDAARKTSAMYLLIGFAAAIKHALRNEPDHMYDDLGPYIQHVPGFLPKDLRNVRGLPIPLEIIAQLQCFVNKYCTAISSPASMTISALTDCLSSLHRIKTSPIPDAYRIHLKQTVVMYLISLPFQLVASPLQWFTIPFVFFAAMTMLGVEQIGAHIENPFGYDPSDLPQDEFCDSIKAEITQLINSQDSDANSKEWITPCSLEIEFVDPNNLKKVTMAAISAHREQLLSHSVTNGCHGYSFDRLVSVHGMVAKLVGARRLQAEV